AVANYTGRSHFAPWMKILGSIHDQNFATGIFTPLVYVEYEASDVPCVPHERIDVRGESWLAKSLDATCAGRHLAREGRHTLYAPNGTILGTARMVNIFTRYDPDPARRRVTELPAELGLGASPSRLIEIPTIDTMADFSRAADFSDSEKHVWHYGQTDPN